MAIIYSVDDSGYHAHDTISGEVLTYKTQAEWLAASFTQISTHLARMIEGLDRLHASHTRPAPLSPQEKTASDADEIPVWP